MSYLLKLYDDNLLEFDIVKTIDGYEVKSLNVKQGMDPFLPLDLKLDGENPEEELSKWLKHRTIPANRAYVQNFLARNGLNERDTFGILDVCKGLSLNDCYWVVDADSGSRFDDYNLYDNRFSRVLAQIAFTGHGSYVGTTFRSSPEFTTGGMLAKCWRRINGKIFLYKTGTEGFANSGMEPYSEFYAYQVAKAMQINAVEYNIGKWKDKLCSTCELFTDKNYSFISIGRLVRNGGMEAVIKYYRDLGQDFYDEMVDMVVFDALIYNEDRHFGNYGFLIDSRTNKILKNAPLFDHGLSLFCYGMKDDMDNISEYAKTRAPATFRSFEESVKLLITERQKRKLRHIFDFSFERHSKYNWPKERMVIIEKHIRERARYLHDLA